MVRGRQRHDPGMDLENHVGVRYIYEARIGNEDGCVRCTTE